VKKLDAPIPRFALTPPEAAASIGCGLDFFNQHVAPHIRLIRVGRKRLAPVTELERWVAENADAAVAMEIEDRSAA
jgi:hypothetical protein